MFQIILELEAKNNLRAHYLYLQTRSPDSAYPGRWYSEIRAAIRDLAASAEECGLAYEDRFFAEGIRQRSYDSYKILFTIRGNRVHVLHIRHQAQNPQDLLG
ncbi:MAG: type II toxin-antitoxin system RelE/ParE family toxin [Longimicrobiales bacterium]|nr:type II toxin-antitoxin system RelE/ParE family toxin [Longimicrobiales bacterium]